MNPVKLFLFSLILVTFSLDAVDQTTWAKADQLLKKQDFLSAFKLSENIIQSDPKDSFGWWLRLSSSSQLANKKGKWPEECLNSAKGHAELVPEEEPSSFTTAIWCLNQDGRYTDMVSLIPKVIPYSQKKIGNGNYGLLINVLTIAYMKLNERIKAREILYTGLTQLSGTEGAMMTGYNVGELFYDSDISMSEREKWHSLFQNNLFKENISNPLIPSIAWNTSLLTDEYVNRGKYNFAYDTISMMYPEMDPHVSGFWNFLRDQMLIKYIALKFKTKKTKEEPRRKLKMMFLVIPKTRLSEPLPNKIKQYQNIDTELSEKALSDLLLSFIYFRDSFEEITNGIHWDYDIIRTNSEIQTTNFTDESFRFVMQPSIESIKPTLSQEILDQIKTSDGVIVVWPGTKQPEGVLITNGGGTEWNYGTNSDPEIRLTIISDSNKTLASGNHANHPIFIYHELFHVLEWAYHKSNFPKKDHPYMRKNEWPRDYQGNTEWDFYSETFNKRMMTEDRMDRLYWLGRKEGFYGIKVKEEKK
ncbi:hypothetical protein [Leptospira bouyouniensis]|uniref:Peptidase MA family protein n=1 Tax=Leptospira bouyouniensis TaxID=2484911 RepID=A0ABY2L141_9LEPT|nr:hypothetical protein [Leptospira bouyouniensis]TGK47006.1 hypothetical protein EHQ10_16855 [Leptospira bouyouniensis]